VAQTQQDRFFSPFRFDPVNQQLFRGEHEIPLRRKTFEVLRYLVDHHGQLVTKAALLDAVWAEVVVSDSMPAICVGELRKALGDQPKAPHFIETVHGRGYRFIAKLTEAEENAPTKPLEPPVASTRIIVGRDAEMALLGKWFSQTLQGQRQIVFATGEAGIGKTAFVQTFLNSIATEYPTVRIGRGQCVQQYGAGEPYMPFLEALGRLCREPNCEWIVERLQQFAPTWLAQMPGLLTSLERARSLGGETQGVTQQRMLREMVQALEALAGQSPLLLLLEDLHWSDFSTLELISAIARRSEAARLMILGTYRIVEMLGGDHRLRTMKEELELHHYCKELRLDLLSKQSVGDYLERRFSTNWSHQFASLATAIHRRTDGNPLFYGECSRFSCRLGLHYSFG
jgi:DNA-binding winged helix-turn-helix (wHTH) protein